MPAPWNHPSNPFYKPVVTCIGCGKFGVILCSHCKQLNEAVLTRIRKLRTTIEQRFSLREK